MNSKTAIQNLIDVPSKFDKAGGTILGESIFNKSLSLNGLSSTEISSSVSTAYTGKGQLFYDSGNKELVVHSVNKIRLSSTGDYVYSTSYPQTSVSGNAGTATKLQTPRSINGTSFDGSSDITTLRWGNSRTFTIGNSSKSVNGQNDMNWSLSEIGAATSSHNHDSSYLKLSGGTLSGNLNFSANNTGVNMTSPSGTSVAALKLNQNNTLDVGNGESVDLIALCSKNNPVWWNGTSTYKLYHTGNFTPRLTWNDSIGRISVDGGGNNANVKYADDSGNSSRINGKNITISQTAPSNPSTGDLWISW